MTDVDRAEVPVLVDEEVDYVDCVEDGGNNDGFGDEAVELVLVGYEREIAANMSERIQVDER